MKMEESLYGQYGLDLGCHLVKKIGTVPKKNFTESSFFEISNTNLFLLQIFAFDFIYVLE